MWSILGLVASAIGIFTEFMSAKEEQEENDRRIGELETRIQQLESQRRTENNENQ